MATEATTALLKDYGVSPSRVGRSRELSKSFSAALPTVADVCSPSSSSSKGEALRHGGYESQPELPALSLVELKRIALAPRSPSPSRNDSSATDDEAGSPTFSPQASRRRRRRPGWGGMTFPSGRDSASSSTLPFRGDAAAMVDDQPYDPVGWPPENAHQLRMVSFAALDTPASQKEGWDKQTPPPLPPRQLQRGESGTVPVANQQRRKGRNPFIDYEARELRMQLEKRWLLEDHEYMTMRTRALDHNTVQARLGKKYGVDLSGSVASLEAPWLYGRPQGRKPIKPPEESMQAQTIQSRAARRGERGELTAIKSLQRRMKDLPTFEMDKNGMPQKPGRRKGFSALELKL